MCHEEELLVEQRNNILWPTRESLTSFKNF